MELKELNALVDSLATSRKTKDAMQEEVDRKREEFELTLEPLTTALAETKELIEQIQTEILEALRESGNKNWKTESATVSRKSTFSYKVADKEKVMTYLAEHQLIGEYAFLELAPHIKSLYETTDVPGVERVEKEFISIIVK